MPTSRIVEVLPESPASKFFTAARLQFKPGPEMQFAAAAAAREIEKRDIKVSGRLGEEIPGFSANFADSRSALIEHYKDAGQKKGAESAVNAIVQQVAKQAREELGPLPREKKAGKYGDSKGSQIS